MVMNMNVAGTIIIPQSINKLYQGIIEKDGHWKIPTGPSVEMYPTWSCKFEAPNKYTMSHDLNTNMVIIQIDLYNPLFSYDISSITETGFTVETRDDIGNPAPCEWKFQLRVNH